MKIRSSFLFVLMASVLCLCDADAYDIYGRQLTNGVRDPEPCPEGCFCINDGKSIQPNMEELICKTEPAEPRTNLGESPTSGYSGGRGLCPDLWLVYRSTYTSEPGTIYYYDQFSELYEGHFGFYGFINGEFVYESGCVSHGNPMVTEIRDGIFNCPRTHPHSAKGSKSLTDCFKYDESGNKVYYGSANYGNCNIEGIRSTVQNLQRALAKAAQDLQDALDKSNQGNKTTPTVSSKTDIDAMKAMISAGITDTKVVSDKQIKKVRK